MIRARLSIHFAQDQRQTSCWKLISTLKTGNATQDRNKVTCLACRTKLTKKEKKTGS